MKYNPLNHNRQSIRLKGFDYSSEGIYFLTINTSGRDQIFGEIKNNKMYLNEIGRAAKEFWEEIPDHFPNVKLDEFVIMPDHVHGIIEIPNLDGSRVYNAMYLSKNYAEPQFKSPSRTVGSIVRGFKIGVTKWLRNTYPERFTKQRLVWQRNYYDEIITNYDVLVRVRNYIRSNPVNWKK